MFKKRSKKSKNINICDTVDMIHKTEIEEQKLETEEKSLPKVNEESEHPIEEKEEDLILNSKELEEAMREQELQSKIKKLKGKNYNTESIN